MKTKGTLSLGYQKSFNHLRRGVMCSDSCFRKSQMDRVERMERRRRK
jgi:hypothetical protein